jgi:hypothetical protein
MGIVDDFLNIPTALLLIGYSIGLYLAFKFLEDHKVPKVNP